MRENFSDAMPMETPIIEIKNLSKSYDGQLVLRDINLQIKPGEFLTLLGPSGCGKTTLLRLIAGFTTVDEGQILLSEKEITHTKPQLRDVHTVFQSYALFPHLTVFDNVAFALRCKNFPKDEILERVDEALKFVKLGQYSKHMPEQLSGGQQQRVAIARAIVDHPSVLLLDEPFSSLDYQLRKSMQIELKQLQRKLNIPFIFVTHDQEEALSMSDRIAVLHDGVIEQLGTPREIYEEPCSLTVAKFIGQLNIFTSTVNAATDEKLEVTIEEKNYQLENTQNYTSDDKVHVLIRPEDLRVWDETEITDKENMLQGIVTEVIYKGSTVDLIVKLNSGKLIAATEFFDDDDEDLAYTIGEKVWVNWHTGWEVVLPFEAF